jgi:hypothetical protein
MRPKKNKLGAARPPEANTEMPRIGIHPLARWRDERVAMGQ